MSRKLLFFYLFLVIILILRLFVFYSSQKHYKDGEYVSFTTQILASPKQYISYKTIYLNIDPSTKALVKTKLDQELNYGDYVNISGNLKAQLLKNNTRIFTITNPKIEAKLQENQTIFSGVYFVRKNIINNFKENLDEASSALLLGIVFGIKDNLPVRFAKDIQTTGVAHVIAASGMNVTMVSGVLFYLLSMIFKRQAAILLSVFGIIFYTALAGFEPSIVRAAIMGIIVFSAQILGKQQFGLLTLLLTGFGMLFTWPQFLFDIGFQLSFVATFGLLYIPSFFNKIKNDFTEVFITTTSAQIATLPILLINFGNYSIFSIITNGLVLWTIPILMILGSIAAIFSFIFSPISTLFLNLCIPLLYFFQKIVSYFATFGSSFSLSSIPWQFGVSYYLLLLSFLVYKFKHE